MGCCVSTSSQNINPHFPNFVNDEIFMRNSTDYEEKISTNYVKDEISENKQCIIKKNKIKKNHKKIIIKCIKTNNYTLIFQNPEFIEYIEYLINDQCDELLNMDPYNMLLMINKHHRHHLINDPKFHWILKLTYEGTYMLYNSKYKDTILNCEFGNDILFDDFDNNMDILMSTHESTLFVMEKATDEILQKIYSSPHKHMLIDFDKGKQYLLNNNDVILISSHDAQLWLSGSKDGIKFLYDNGIKKMAVSTLQGAKYVYKLKDYETLMESQAGLYILLTHKRYDLICESENGISVIKKMIKNDLSNLYFSFSPKNKIVRTKKEKNIKYITINQKNLVNEISKYEEGCLFLLNYPEHFQFIIKNNNPKILLKSEKGRSYLLDNEYYDILMLSDDGQNLLLTKEDGLKKLFESDEGKKKLMSCQTGQKFLYSFEEGISFLFETSIGNTFLQNREYTLNKKVYCPICRTSNTKYKVYKCMNDNNQCYICYNNIKYYIKFTNCDNHGESKCCINCVKNIK